MGRVSRDARLLFVQMWTLADDSGRLRGNSRMLASLLFPYDDDAPELIFGWLEELETQNCIVRYKGDDGSHYVAICKWSDHQRIDKPSESKLPAPNSENILESSRKVANPREQSCLDQGSRTKDQGRDQEDMSAESGRKKYTDEFERFWSVFPSTRKTKKAEAFRKWKIALKHSDADTLTKRAEEYASSPVGRSEYAVMPSVWLNSGMWEDEPDAWEIGRSKVGGNLQKEIAW